MQVIALPCGVCAANAYLCLPAGRNDCFLVDPGDELAPIENALEQSGRALSAILLTHRHFDHILAAAPIQAQTGAPIYIHPDDEPALFQPDQCLYDRSFCRLPFEAPGGEVRAAVGAIEVCGLEISVLHTPGHSAGSVSFLVGSENALFTGDTLFVGGWGRTDLIGANERQLIESLRTLLSLPGGLVAYPGHGGHATIAEIARGFAL